MLRTETRLTGKKKKKEETQQNRTKSIVSATFSTTAGLLICQSITKPLLGQHIYHSFNIICHLPSFRKERDQFQLKYEK